MEILPSMFDSWGKGFSKLTLAKAFSLSEFCEVSLLEFQTNAICILPGHRDKLINSRFSKTLSNGLNYHQLSS